MTFPARKRGSEFMKIKCLMPDVQFEMPAKGRLGEGGVTGYLAGLGVDGPEFLLKTSKQNTQIVCAHCRRIDK